MLSITRLFRLGARLDEIFDFHGDFPEWSHQKAWIIVRKEDGSFAAFYFVGGVPELPSAGAAFRPEHTDDVQKWTELMHTGWCIPGKNMTRYTYVYGARRWSETLCRLSDEVLS